MVLLLSSAHVFEAARKDGRPRRELGATCFSSLAAGSTLSGCRICRAQMEAPVSALALMGMT